MPARYNLYCYLLYEYSSVHVILLTYFSVILYDQRLVISSQKLVGKISVSKTKTAFPDDLNSIDSIALRDVHRYARLPYETIYHPLAVESLSRMMRVLRMCMYSYNIEDDLQ